ncbi:MFS transporter [Leucobacter ruminantium]|uniref:MFS transporter n=1 Tax=Leucobacter ruminantium TaxID=1289170 RepID=A0A939RY61_9MICO|nr:MFS transporter [Leucobacter ruminantium]MBO1804129.1 MFS transporter [Leucobacter ruminantium]
MPQVETNNSPDTKRATLFSHTGFAYFPLAIVARLPFAMVVVGVLTLIVSSRGSVEIGGLGSAMVGLGSAIVGPLIGAAADRFGQRPTLLVSAAANSAALGLLAWAAYADISVWWVFAAAFCVGASVPQVSPMSRSRLVTIITSRLPADRAPRTLSTTLAYESTADEIVFVFGPVVVGVLATVLGAWAPVAGAAVLTLVFVVAFALHRTAVPARTRAERAATLAPAGDLLRPTLLVTVLGIFGVGLVFGTVLTSLTAFMQARGEAEAAGVLYGVMGLGSAIFALSVALFSTRFTLRYRWLVFSACIVAGATVLSQAETVGWVIAGLALTGIGIGPLLVTIYGFGAARSPEGRSATVMTMLGSAIMLGQSLAAGVTGAVAESQGVAAAQFLPLCAAGLTLATGIANWALTRTTAEAR